MDDEVDGRFSRIQILNPYLLLLSRERSQVTAELSGFLVPKVLRIHVGQDG